MATAETNGRGQPRLLGREVAFAVEGTWLADGR